MFNILKDNKIVLDKEQAVKDIIYIKEIINSGTQYTNISGVASIISGILALLGCIFSFYLIPKNNELSKIFNISYPLILVWVSIFFLAVFANILFSYQKAKKTGQPAWSRLSKLIIYALSPPLLIGGFLTLFLAMENKKEWIPAIWMIGYGLGIWSAGLFSIKGHRVLGLLFIITGLLTLFFFVNYSLLMMAISFGFFHIIYGFRLCFKYGA